MKNNNMFKRIFFAIVLLMMIVTSFSVFRININAESSNTVYLKDSVVEADASGLVIVEIVGEGKAGAEVSVFIHTEGGTAIPGLDYVNVNTLVRAKYGSDGKLSYKVSIKCLVTPESREKLRQNLLESQEKQLNQFDEEPKNLQPRLENSLRNCNPQSKAANAWRRITNALIRKYKPMTEEDPNRALKELTRIEGVLLAGGFLTEQDLKEAL